MTSSSRRSQDRSEHSQHPSEDSQYSLPKEQAQDSSHVTDSENDTTSAVLQLDTRDDLAALLHRLTKPLLPLYSEGKARLRIGHTGASYPADIAEMEGFSRVLWGLVPLLAGGGDSVLWDNVLEGIRHGTNPEHPEYWGDVNDYDQRLVEMAAFGLALALIPERIWTPLSADEQSNLYRWLNQINHHPCYDCNWLFFNVLVNVGFRRAGLDYDAEQLETNVQRMDAFYLEDGWYSDGVNGHSDYYVPFAIHYYGLVYARLMEQDDPERSRIFKQRAAKFATEFLAWFAQDGSALPYGRSLSYRFAQSAFWSALAYAEVDVLPAGVLKGLVLRHLRWWMEQPIVDGRGVLTIGYAYPNLVMAENYNSPGSPYWALKAFLPLALSQKHPFWSEEEQPLPEMDTYHVQQPAHLVIVREQNAGHVAAFNSGHRYTNEHTHTSAKYEKFVYSTGFGFSVPRSEWGLGQGAFDSMLALSEHEDHLYRVRRRNVETNITDNVLHAIWKPWHDVEVQTWLIAGLPWHLRIHRVETARMLDAAEGGYALGQEKQWQAHTQPTATAVMTAHGSSGIIGLRGYEQAELIWPNANTNLLHPRTVLPTLKATVKPGVHWLIAAVYGDPAKGDAIPDEAYVRELVSQSPADLLHVNIAEKQIIVTTHTGKEITIKLNG